LPQSADYDQIVALSKKLSSILFISVSALAIVMLSSIEPATTTVAADEEDFEENSLIKICYTWGKDLADGILTYSIAGNVDAKKREAVHANSWKLMSEDKHNNNNNNNNNNNPSFPETTTIICKS
jgi:hypothetical protein